MVSLDIDNGVLGFAIADGDGVDFVLGTQVPHHTVRTVHVVNQVTLKPVLPTHNIQEDNST